METPPVIRFITMVKAAAKRCGFAAAILEVKELNRYYVDVNVTRLSDRRVIFCDHIPYKELHASTERITDSVARSIYREYERLNERQRCPPEWHAFGFSLN